MKKLMLYFLLCFVLSSNVAYSMDGEYADDQGYDQEENDFQNDDGGYQNNNRFQNGNSYQNNVAYQNGSNYQNDGGFEEEYDDEFSEEDQEQAKHIVNDMLHLNDDMKKAVDEQHRNSYQNGKVAFHKLKSVKSQQQSIPDQIASMQKTIDQLVKYHKPGSGRKNSSASKKSSKKISYDRSTRISGKSFTVKANPKNTKLFRPDYRKVSESYNRSSSSRVGSSPSKVRRYKIKSYGSGKVELTD